MGFSGGKLRPYSQRPYSDGIDESMAAFLDWVQTSLNTLIGQRLNTTGTGFSGLQNPVLNPATQLSSTGSRTSRTATIGVMIVAAPGGNVTFYYDGTNGSQPFRLYRDDGTITTPVPGSQAVTGLVGQLCNFYPYYDEVAGTVKFINNSALSTALQTSVTVMIGVPAIGLQASVANVNKYDAIARQLCMAPNRVPLFTLQGAAVNGPASSIGPPQTAAAGTFFLFTRAGSGY